jgi:hypothetical protein
MKLLFKSILLAVAVLCLAGTARGDTDRIAVYADESASSCNLVDIGTQVHEVFVVITNNTGIDAVEFQILPADGAALTYLGQAIPEYAVGAMGRADTGVAIAMGGCFENGTLTLLTVLYQGLGVSGSCSQLSIGPNPMASVRNGDKIRFITCEAQNAWADPGHLTVNPDDDCECETDPEDQPSPVASTTWSGIKALYVD